MPSGVCHPPAEKSGEGPAKALLGCLVKTKNVQRFEDFASKFQRAEIATSLVFYFLPGVILIT